MSQKFPESSTVKAEFKARADRLIRGEFRPEDINALFLYLRNRSRGRETVREIGDFFAHRDERQKGLVTNHTKDWFIVVRYMIATRKQPHKIDKCPANFGEVLEAALRQLTDQEIRQDTGLRRKAVKRLLTGIIRRLEPNNSGGLTGEKIVDPKELSVINCLTRRIKGIGSAFSEDKIFTQFRDTLLANDLLDTKEAQELSKVRKAVSLSVVAAMHLTEIDLGDGTKAKLLASADSSSRGTIGVMALAPVYSPEAKGDIFLGSALYVTTFNADACCEPALLQHPTFPNWECPIELTRNTTLEPLL